jgi:glycerol-1-phosphate dehydrogenase [NAD(P)+]
VVVVGSGTITDVAKASSPPGVPLVVVQTAASVNGYSDHVSVLLRKGAKRTVPTRWPDALIVDLETLAAAPRTLNASGFGDAISLWTGPADWYLASALEFAPGYHPAPIELLATDGARLLDEGRGVRDGELQALDLLARVLSLGGIAIGLTQTTATVSGVEHLVSHLLDMAAGQAHRPTALHGAQVGVATIVAAAVWEHVLDELDVQRIDVDRCFPPLEDVEAAVRVAWAGASEPLIEECRRDCAAKLERWHGCRGALRAFLAAWPTERKRLRSLTRPPERIAAALRAAGAPTRFSELEPAIDPAVARWAVRNCHLMRNRLTVVDLLFYAGHWDDAAADRVLDRAAAVGGGL